MTMNVRIKKPTGVASYRVMGRCSLRSMQIRIATTNAKVVKIINNVLLMGAKIIYAWLKLWV